jgi:signal transduction histidine kinase
MGNLEMAINYADSALELVEKVSITEGDLEAYRLARIIYMKAKQYEKALSASEKYDKLIKQYSDSLILSAQIENESKFRFQAQDIEIQNLKDLQEKQAELSSAQNKILMLGTGIIVFLLIGVILLVLLVDKSNKTAKELESKNTIIDSQLITMKQQNDLQLMTIGIIGHDLRGPLSSAVSLRKILFTYLEQHEINKAKELGNVLFDSIERINSLANNLVTWVSASKQGMKFNFLEVKLESIVQNLVTQFDLELKNKQIQLILSMDNTISIYADPVSFETIMRNILQNAIKFSPINSKIWISAAVSKSTSNEVEICIKDEGLGMPANILVKLNEGKRMINLGTLGEKGNGLGLIMIQTLLSLNQGKMKINSTEGTEFIVVMPAKKG